MFDGMSMKRLIDPDESILRFLEHETGLQYGDVARRVAYLTDREFEIFQLMGQGAKNREIAARLGISTKTGDVHRGVIYRKLEVNAATFGKLYWLFHLARALHAKVFEQAKAARAADR